MITKTVPNTWNEVLDGVVDYYVDLYFATSPPYYPVPEPYITVLIVIGVVAVLTIYCLKRLK